jgi:hypothetical protein
LYELEADFYNVVKHIYNIFVPASQQKVSLVVRASASRSTGEFVSRRSHYRDIRYQTKSFIPDIQCCIEITLVGRLALLADRV